MREIKFRAWDKEYGFMYQNAYPFEHLVYVEMHDDDDTFQQFQHKMEVVNGKHFYFIIAKDMELMQFTGLLDKNGKDIYEGDIVIWDGGQYTVAFSEVEGSWILKDDRDDWECPSLYGVSSPAQSRIEIIGNIYEKPKVKT